ncbi:MAG: nuclear transport factor 2 family protein [Candidatus Binatus sp.]|uniref:nuclear transport factor 2 family protein n=1 Tax=Candidatus Binatus sp. TaxID=2811406 RepID=UPI0027225EE6|nr:nuclear transport factor 2 family protein [Candidatus Binatus sp.]MDO8432810.1 nuclear transport factor 2 family protein [Candidatus Binatus sp.]
MGASENKQAIKTMFAELAKGNAQAFLGAMTDDVRFTLIGTTKYSRVFNGKQELLEKLLGPLNAELVDGITITPDNLIADGDYVAMQAHGKAMGKNGKPYNNTYCQVFKFTNGKICEVTEYLDTELVTTVFGR